MRKGRRTAAVVGFVLAGFLSGTAGCSPLHGDPTGGLQAQPTVRESHQHEERACGAGTALPPREGAWLGVSIDWSNDTLPSYAHRLGHDPAMAVTFAHMPMSAQDRRNVTGAVQQAAQIHSGLLLTLEPRTGLRSVTADTAAVMARQLHRYNSAGVPVIVRFAHEMNGSWYPWGSSLSDTSRPFARSRTPSTVPPRARP